MKDLRPLEKTRKLGEHYGIDLGRNKEKREGSYLELRRKLRGMGVNECEDWILRKLELRCAILLGAF